MSSFVISKVEYIKAAGFVSGIMKACNNGWCTGSVWIWDSELKRALTEIDIYNRFVDCFNMNSKSVYDQYSPRHPDEVLCVDEIHYTEEYLQYTDIGAALADDPERLAPALQDLHDFFDSALYQTSEDREANKKMSDFFNSILLALMPVAYPHETTCWGRFNVKNFS